MRERCSVFGSLSQGRRLLKGDLPRNLQKVAPRIDTLRYLDLRHTCLALCLCGSVSVCDIDGCSL